MTINETFFTVLAALFVFFFIICIGKYILVELGMVLLNFVNKIVDTGGLALAIPILVILFFFGFYTFGF